MKFLLRIECDNAAFEQCSGAEVARILRSLAEQIEGDSLECGIGKLRDINGNQVGKWTVVGERPPTDHSKRNLAEFLKGLLSEGGAA